VLLGVKYEKRKGKGVKFVAGKKGKEKDKMGSKIMQISKN
jgi:hypothetical protein